MKTWRDTCRPIITQVLAETAGKSEDDINQALFEAYPFGERKMHPYKIWRSEIKAQRTGKPVPKFGAKKVLPAMAGQGELFE